MLSAYMKLHSRSHKEPSRHNWRSMEWTKASRRRLGYLTARRPNTTLLRLIVSAYLAQNAYLVHTSTSHKSASADAVCSPNQRKTMSSDQDRQTQKSVQFTPIVYPQNTNGILKCVVKSNKWIAGLQHAEEYPEVTEQ